VSKRKWLSLASDEWSIRLTVRILHYATSVFPAWQWFQGIFC
jgi:hypothetical protein